MSSKTKQIAEIKKAWAQFPPTTLFYYEFPDGFISDGAVSVSLYPHSGDASKPKEQEKVFMTNEMAGAFFDIIPTVNYLLSVIEELQ